MENSISQLYAELLLDKTECQAGRGKNKNSRSDKKAEQKQNFGGKTANRQHHKEEGKQQQRDQPSGLKI